MDPQQPAIPATANAPRVGSCPTGWTNPSIDFACAPYDREGSADCEAIDEVHLPGMPECTRLGPACPAQHEFDTGVPIDRPVWYVDGAAMAGGRGTKTSPFHTLADAIERVAEGEVIALAPGRYQGPFDLPSGVTLWGACALGTTLTASTGEAVVHARSGDVALRSIAIADSAVSGVIVEGRRLVLRDVVVSHATGVAIRAIGSATLDVDGLSVRGTAIGEGEAAIAIEGSDAMIAHASVTGSAGAAIAISGEETTASFTDALVSHNGGRGIDVAHGATARIERVVIEESHDVGFAASGEHVRASLAHIVVTGTRSRMDGLFGRGLAIGGGASVDANHLLVQGNQEAGFVVDGAGTTMTLRDAVVRDNAGGEPRGALGMGGAVRRGAQATIERVRFGRNHEVGLLIENASTNVAMTDVVVRDTQADEDLDSGRGIDVRDRAEVSLVRGDIESNREIGLSVSYHARMRLEDVTVRATLSRAFDGLVGRGLNVQEDAEVSAHRLLLANNSEIGLAVLGGGQADVEDVTVLGATEGFADALGAAGVIANQGGRLDGTRIIVRGTRVVGVAAGNDAHISFAEALIEDARAKACEPPCTPEYGIGVGGYLGGSVALDGFAIRAAELCGVQIALDGMVSLRDGEVTNNAIGACLQVDGYDVDQLQDGVRYLANLQNLDTTMLPIPDLTGIEAAAPIGDD